MLNMYLNHWCSNFSLHIFQVLNVGGCVLFRDYGLFDHAQLRFKKGHKLSENFYCRQDNTRAYYFSTGWYYLLLPLVIIPKY